MKVVVEAIRIHEKKNWLCALGYFGRSRTCFKVYKSRFLRCKEAYTAGSSSDVFIAVGRMLEHVLYCASDHQLRGIKYHPREIVLPPK